MRRGFRNRVVRASTKRSIEVRLGALSGAITDQQLMFEK
jgi:hypothetical protein